MRFVTPFLKRIVYPGLSTAGYFRGTERPGLAVVTYHGILPSGYKPIDPGFDGSLITAQSFRAQLRLLKAQFTVISPEDMLSWCRHECPLPQRAVLLTCDDGFLNNLTEMVPILQDEGVRCLFFVTGLSAGTERTMLWYEELLLMFLRARPGNFRIVSDPIELNGVLAGCEQRRALWWDSVKQLSQLDAQSRERFLHVAHSCLCLPRTYEFYLANYPKTCRHFSLLTCAELQELAAAGMTIGAHTMSHPFLAQMPAELAWREIANGRACLEAALGKPVWAFAYPFGGPDSITPRVVAMTKQAGFEAGFLNTGGGLGAELPLFGIPRVHVNAGMGLAEFEAHVSGFYGALQRRLRREPGFGELYPDTTPTYVPLQHPDGAATLTTLTSPAGGPSAASI